MVAFDLFESHTCQLAYFCTVLKWCNCEQCLLAQFQIFFDYDIQHSMARSFANFYPTDMIDTLF